MQRSKSGRTFGLFTLIITVLAVPALPARSAVERTALIQSVRAVQDSDETVCDIVLGGPSTPVLAAEGKRLTVTLPNAAPDPRLAENIASGGLVSRVALEMATPPARLARVRLELSAPGLARLSQGPDKWTVRVRIAPVRQEMPAGSFRKRADHLYDIDAYQSDLAGLLKSLARDAGVSVVLTGAIKTPVTVNLRQVPFEKAVDLLTKSAGLTYQQDGATFVVGTAKEIETAYPKAAPPAEPVMREEIYRCRYVSAAKLLTTLEKMFDKDALRVALGAGASSPLLENTSASAKATGTQADLLKSAPSEEPDLTRRDLILYGQEKVVARALALAQKLDTRRAQVRIGVRISDINLDSLKELGLQWSWSNVGLREKAPSGISFGSFTRDPLFVEAALSALERNDAAKLLASPTISLLDGERSFILIGERKLYPRLVGYTQAQTPIFEQAEVLVGIYLQVAVQVGDNGEITLSLYPQVSVINGFLNINGGSYPQISTREQQTTVRVKDREPVVIGGLISDEEIKNVQRVPGLSRIPLFGELFTYRKTTRRRSEVVITITPEILKD